MDLKQRLDSQEQLLKEIYDVKLTELEENLKDHVDARYVDLQKFITKTLNISSTVLTPITQQSQPKGPANGRVMVEKSPTPGGGL